MCTVIVHVPETPGAPVRLLAVRDEDPARAWWPESPDVVGVRDRRAGGAWLAADPAAGRIAVILNRADIVPDGDAPLESRGRIVLDAVGGAALETPPHTHGFNLVELTATGATVTMWDGDALRRVELAPGIHMIAHDDVDDPATARIAAWRDAFDAPETVGEEWRERWLDTLERTSAVGPRRRPRDRARQPPVRVSDAVAARVHRLRRGIRRRRALRRVRRAGGVEPAGRALTGLPGADARNDCRDRVGGPW